MAFDSRGFEKYHVEKVAQRGMFRCIADKYRINELVGGGSFSVVYRASEIRGNRRVAVKALLREVYDAASSRKYAESELNAMGQLWDHQNIVSALTVEPGNKEFLEFIVMEYVDGGSLDGRLDKGPMSIQEALAVAHDICSGLAHAHRRNIVHRDIKPSNILLTSEGEAKVSDFGVAELRESPHAFPSTLAGTRRYMAPEQYNDMYDERVDVFAVGILLWEMTVGVFPYPGNAHNQIQRAKENDPEPPVDLPSSVKEILHGSLRADPFDRFRSMDEMLAAVEDELMAIYRREARECYTSREPLQAARARLDPLRRALRIDGPASRRLEELAEMDAQQTAEDRSAARAREAASDLSDQLMECVMRGDFREAENRAKELADTGAVPRSALNAIDGLLRMLKGPSYSVPSSVDAPRAPPRSPLQSLFNAGADPAELRAEGQRLESQRRWRQARSAYQKSAKLYAKEGLSKRNAGDLWHAAEKYELAGDSYRSAQNKRQSALHFCIAADCWIEHAKRMGSRRERVARAEIYRNAARAYEQAENEERARECYQSTASLLYQAAQERIGKGDLQKAKTYALSALDLSKKTGAWAQAETSRHLLSVIRQREERKTSDSPTDAAP